MAFLLLCYTMYNAAEKMSNCLLAMSMYEKGDGSIFH